MKRHTRIYLKAFDYDESSFIPCEIPNCGRRAVDIHHIDARGMGGAKDRDRPDNLMAICREHHVEYGDKKEFKDWLKEIHQKRLMAVVR